MAASRRGNTYYCPPAESNDLVTTNNKHLNVFSIFVANVGTDNQVVTISDMSGTDATTKLTLFPPTVTTNFYDMQASPMSFPGGLRVVTPSDTHVTLILKPGGV